MLARWLEQVFLWVELHRATSLSPSAMGPQWARRTHFSGKHERPTSTLSGSQVTSGVLVRAGTRASLHINLKRSLGEELLVVDLGHLGDYRPSTVREFRARAASSIDAVATPLHYSTVRRGSRRYH